MQPAHWNETLKRFCFEKLHATEVSCALRSRTYDALKFACEDLQLSIPEVVWIRPMSPDLATDKFNLWKQVSADVTLGSRPPVIWRDEDITEGYTPSEKFLNEIWIRGELNGFPSLEFIAMHEVRHICQKINDINVFKDPCRAECDAYPYADSTLRRYLAAKGRLTLEIESAIKIKMDAIRFALSQCCAHVPFEVIGGLRCRQ